MGSVCCKQDSLPKSVVKANRVTLAGSAVIVSAGVLLGGDHGLPSHPTRMLRIALFGGLFGSQIWNTFINGVVLITTQSRHTFGSVQRYILPAYFNYTSILSASALAVHLYFYPYSMWTKCERTFTLANGTILACSFIQAFCLMGANLERMNKMFAMEKEVGLGDQVGPIKDDRLLQNKDYKQLKKSFGMAHGISSLVNLLSLSGSVVQLVYFAQHGF